MTGNQGGIGVLLVCSSLKTGTAAAEKAAPPGQLGLAIAAADTDAFIEEWVATASNRSPVIHLVHEVAPEQTIYIAFIVSGHLHDSNGQAQVDVDWVLRRPDGEVDHEERSF